MISVQFTCPSCASSINVYPDKEANFVKCDICEHELPVSFNDDHIEGNVKDCPCCKRKDFYQQKDFNRKIGVILFIIASILSIWTYGISFIVLYAVDFFLFQKLKYIVICYKCNTIFRDVANKDEILTFDHEMNDRIVYADHDFEGKPITH